MNDLSRKIIHIDMDAFLLQSKSETTPNLKANQLLLEMTQERLVVVELSQLVAMKRDPLVFTQP